MSRPLNLWDQIFLPFYSSETIARKVTNKPEKDIVLILNALKPEKSLEVLNCWSEAVRVQIMKELGDYGLKVLRLVPADELCRLMVMLPAQMVKRLGTDMTDRALIAMMNEWSDEDRVSVFSKLPTDKAGMLFKHMGIEDRVTLIKRFKPWIGAALMEWVDVEGKARVLERLDSTLALDLFDRWGNYIQCDVLPLLEERCRNEIISSLRPRQMAAIFARWDCKQASDVLLSLSSEKQASIFKLLPEKHQISVYPDMPDELKRQLVKEVDDLKATALLMILPSKSDREKILSKMHPERAASIRKLMIFGG